MSSGAIVTFNDPRRFGSMKLVAARQARRRAAAGAARPRAARQRLRRRDAGARLRGQEDEPQGGAAGPARRGRARQHLCLRSAASRAAVAQAHRRDHRRARPARRTSAPNGWSTRIKAVLNDAIKAGGSSLRDHKLTDGELGMFQHHFPRLRPRGRKMPHARLPRHRQTHRAERPLDVLLSGVPEIIIRERQRRRQAS